jgi:glutamyl-tRNA reductase
MVLGASIKTSPIEVREPLSFPPSELQPALQRMTAYVPEGAILSTCHRVELYAAADGSSASRTALKRFWFEQRRPRPRGIDAHLYFLEDDEAVRHAFSVASGLDSAIFGEPQILGQVRDALDRALAAGAAGPTLAGLFRGAVRTGRRVRTETGVGRNAASVSYAAVELACGVLGDVRSARALLVGTGKMGEITAKNLLAKGVAQLAVAGRTLDRAQELVLECGNAGHIAQLEQALPESDIVISCTSAPHHVIHRDMVERAMRERGGRPMFLIDVAVPRDIEPSAGSIDGVHLFNIDDLEARVVSNMQGRRAETRRARAIIEEEVHAFRSWLAVRGAVPTITALRRHAEAIRQAELARTASVLARLPEADRRRIEALTLALQKKLLHQPIALLRTEAAIGDGADTDRAVRRLFALD